ncbi:MAG: TonB-dependent receptor, partial [Thermoguttaceae bacterium]|nr:TonB-dependent receptor [Thermoguttaceae bacterium]
VISILDLEVGGGWRSQNDVLRVTAGYMFSAWYNVISTEELINAVQSADSTNADDTLTFSGLVVRSEVRF